MRRCPRRGDAEPDLVQVLGPVPELARTWRVLAHPDVRGTPCVSAFIDFVVEEIETLADPDAVMAWPHQAGRRPRCSSVVRGFSLAPRFVN